VIYRLLVALVLAGAPLAAYADAPKPAKAGYDPYPIDITAAGDVRANGKPVTDAELATEIKALVAKAKDTTVEIRADAKVPHGRVVQVMDIVRQAGITKIAIATAK